MVHIFKSRFTSKLFHFSLMQADRSCIGVGKIYTFRTNRNRITRREVSTEGHGASGNLQISKRHTNNALSDLLASPPPPTSWNELRLDHNRRQIRPASRIIVSCL